MHSRRPNAFLRQRIPIAALQITLAACLLAGPQVRPAAALDGPLSIPQTPAGEILGSWLGAHNQGTAEALRTWLRASLSPAISDAAVEERLGWYVEAVDMLGSRDSGVLRRLATELDDVEQRADVDGLRRVIGRLETLVVRDELGSERLVVSQRAHEAPTKGADLRWDTKVASPAVDAAGARSLEVELEELWRVGADPQGVLFGNIDRVVETASGLVLALDTQLAHVLVFAADGEFLRRIGGPGEGPGELDRPEDMFVGPDDIVGLLQAYPGRVVTVGIDGIPRDRFEPLGRFQGKTPSFRRVEGNADRVVVAASQTVEENEREHSLRVFDAQGKFLHELHRERGTFTYGGMAYEEATFRRFHRRWSLGRSGRVAAAVGHDALRVHVWDPDGTPAFVVEDDEYVPPTRTNAEKKVLQRYFDSIVSFNPNSSFAISARHPAVVAVDVRDDDSVWIVDGHGAHRTAPGVGMVVRVYGADGAFAHALVLQGDIDLSRDEVHFGRDHVYVVTEAVDTAVSATGGADDTVNADGVNVSELVCYRVRAPGIE